ncbi:hypothetical protein ATK74_0437 [Propionicimonas paludicola]|uniref:Uncharacterized protein n=1 Tax=Propionicimonas paludicola TaxID=185243 RepID=A0A2A9CP38_9ACTN|nr:DUF5719 family protein [Propionicimonas paludicola]PFG15916.1 hypothetical protein ATK74_0437 [Propionicimonas paludicola]
MNRWLLSLGSIAVVVGLTVAGSLVAPAALPLTEVPTVATRSTLVCPGFASATATRTVIAASTQSDLRLAKLSAPQNPKTGTGLVRLSDSEEPVRVSAERTGAFGATTTVTAADGSDRGLSMARCLLPQPEYWFTGVLVGTNSGSEVDLVNLDGTRAVVDLTAYGPSGKLAATRGVVVDPGAEKKVSLALIQRGDQPITVRVTSSEGRIAAFLRQRSWGATRPLGADWLPASAAPATDLVVPGVPDGAGRRTLVLGNPGDRTAVVKVDVLSASGPTNVVGAVNVEVLAGTTKAVELSAGLGGGAAGVHLSSDQPITAGLLADSGGSENEIDPASAAAADALPDDGIWPLALAKSATAVVTFTNPESAAVTATVTLGSGGTGQDSTVKIPAQSTVTFAVPKSSASSIRIRTQATTLRAAVVVRQTVGKVKGLAVVVLMAGQGRTEPIQVGYDPHLGS